MGNSKGRVVWGTEEGKPVKETVHRKGVARDVGGRGEKRVLEGRCIIHCQII